MTGRQVAYDLGPFWIGLDASIIRGSHGRLPQPGSEQTDGPTFISSSRAIERDAIAMTDVKEILLRLQFDS